MLQLLVQLLLFKQKVLAHSHLIHNIPRFVLQPYIQYRIQVLLFIVLHNVLQRTQSIFQDVNRLMNNRVVIKSFVSIKWFREVQEIERGQQVVVLAIHIEFLVFCIFLLQVCELINVQFGELLVRRGFSGFPQLLEDLVHYFDLFACYVLLFEVEVQDFVVVLEDLQMFSQNYAISYCQLLNMMEVVRRMLFFKVIQLILRILDYLILVRVIEFNLDFWLLGEVYRLMSILLRS